MYIIKTVKLERGRVKKINGSTAVVNVKGKKVNVRVPFIDCILRENQVVMVGYFNGQYRIIG